MESLLIYIFCSVIIIPALTRLIWYNKKIRKTIKKKYKEINKKLISMRIIN